jgi:hypothetical protein
MGQVPSSDSNTIQGAAPQILKFAFNSNDSRLLYISIPFGGVKSELELEGTNL